MFILYLQCLAVVWGRLCCFGETDSKSEFAQLVQSVQYDRYHDMSPIVSQEGQEDEPQRQTNEVRSGIG